MKQDLLNRKLNIYFKKLATLQGSDGLFFGTNTTTKEAIETTFYSSLIVRCLRGASGVHAKKIIGLSVSKIEQLLTTSCSLNYLLNQKIYPNDLDTTINAYLALQTTRNLSEEELLNITTLLIGNETSPGGPYKTWITNNNDPIWGDIDIVVNSSIFYFLSQENILTPPLREYLEGRIQSRNFSSQFYNNQFLVFYFLSKNVLSHESKKILQTELNTLVLGSNELTPVEQAILIIVFINVSKPASSWKNYYDALLITNTVVPTENFYIEKAKGGLVECSGSQAFGYALIIEALTLGYKTITVCNTNSRKPTETQLDSNLVKVFEETPRIFSQLESILTNIKKDKKLIDILSIINTLKREFSITYTNDVTTISIATLVGTIGYTLHDDIIDRQKKIELLPAASLCMFHAHKLFLSIAKNDSQCTLITSTLTSIHETLHQELQAEPINYFIAAKKSLGIALGPLLLFTFSSPSQKEIISLKNYFALLIAVKQLNDDLHDWYEDFEGGRNTPITQELKKFQAHRETKTNLSKIFWNTIFPKYVRLFRSYIKQAFVNLNNVTSIQNKKVFIDLLEQELFSFEQSIYQRNQTLAFLELYKKDHP